MYILEEDGGGAERTPGQPRLVRSASALAALTEAEREAAFGLLDPLAREAARRWLAPLVLHAVEVALERALTSGALATAKGQAPLLDVAGVARRLSVSERSVERLVAEGLLSPVWVGGARRFAPEAVESFLKRYAVRGRQDTKGGAGGRSKRA